MDEYLRNENYMDPDYEYQSAAAMNKRLATHEALEAATEVQRQVCVAVRKKQTKRKNLKKTAANSTFNPHEITNCN